MSSLTLSKEEEKRLKGLGFLNNKGTDNFSARILTVNGKVTAAQHRAIADAAETFGNGILTFTTRQTVEVQGIPYEKLEEFQEFVENAGMTIGGTGAKVRPVVSCKGNTVRQIIVCIDKFHDTLTVTAKRVIPTIAFAVTDLHSKLCAVFQRDEKTITAVAEESSHGTAVITILITHDACIGNWIRNSTLNR